MWARARAPDAHEVSQAFLTRFQPALERDGFSARLVKRFGCAPHAALDLSDVGLSSRVRRLLLAPLGAIDAFLVIDEDQVVGWLSACTRTRAATVLSRAPFENLTDIAAPNTRATIFSRVLAY